MEAVDTIYYCNLNHRVDRNLEFLSEMKKLGIPETKIHRVESVYNPEFGIIGCAKSHIQVLEHFLESEKQTCAVFEDDFTFTVPKETVEATLAQFFHDIGRDFDCLMLGGNILSSVSTDFSYLKRVLDGQCASSYVITREIAPVLLKLWKEALQRHEVYISRFGRVNHFDCLDIAWKSLQPTSRWLITEPKFGIQRDSYSDIEHKVVSYKV